MEYLLTECVTEYNSREDKFSFDFLQTIYQENHRDDLLIKSWCTWAHCGGCGSIIVNGSKKGYESGEMYGHFLKINQRF